MISSLSHLWLLAAGVLPAMAQDQTPLGVLEASAREVQLENGWRFLLLPRPGAPLVSFETRIDAGSAMDPPGRSGLAGLVARVLPSGSDRIGSLDWDAERAALEEADRLHAQLALLPARTSSAVREPVEEAFRAACASAARLGDAREFQRVWDEVGAMRLAVEMDADASTLSVTLPASRVEAFFWMERERLSRPALRTLYAVRDALRVETRTPSQVLREELAATAFRSHPYRHPPSGFPGELSLLSREDARSFVRTHCGARRLVTAIVGNFDPERVKELIERYGSSLPAGPLGRPQAPADPPQLGERRVEKATSNTPWLGMGWRVPGVDHADTPALQAAFAILFRGSGARVRRRLVDTAAALRFDDGVPGRYQEHLAVVLASPLADVPCATIERVIAEEVQRLARDGPEQWELEGLVRAARLALLADARDSAALARRLVEHEVTAAGWRSAFRTPELLAAVTVDDVRKATQRYLRDDNRCVVRLTPTHAREASR